MIYQKLRKSGNSYVVTVPMETVHELDLEEGDLVELQVNKAEIRTIMRDEVKAAFEASLKESKDAYEFLGR